MEVSELEKHESVIKRGLKTFSDVGNSLLVIRDSRLYREQYATFEEYCGEKWGMNRNYANKLIVAAEVVGNLGTIVPKPTTESQARPLAKLEPGKQAEVWESVVEKAKKEERKVTAKDVEMEVEKKIKQTEVKRKIGPPCAGMMLAQVAVRKLEEIADNDEERKEAFKYVKGWIIDHE
jgi:hypothetical protein